MTSEATRNLNKASGSRGMTKSVVSIWAIRAVSIQFNHEWANVIHEPELSLTQHSPSSLTIRAHSTSIPYVTRHLNRSFHQYHLSILLCLLMYLFSCAQMSSMELGTQQYGASLTTWRSLLLSKTSAAYVGFLWLFLTNSIFRSIPSLSCRWLVQLLWMVASVVHDGDWVGMEFFQETR